MPKIRRSTGGLIRGNLFDTNIKATSIDEDIFSDQELLDETANDSDLISPDHSCNCFSWCITLEWLNPPISVKPNSAYINEYCNTMNKYILSSLIS